MTEHDLYHSIGNLSDDIIEESAEIRRKPRWLGFAALAACAVLAVSVSLAAGIRSAGSVEQEAQPVGEHKAEPSNTWNNAESPAEEELQEEAAKFSARAEEVILSAKLNGLWLGMEREQVRTQIGDPRSISNIGETQRSDGVWEVCWFYNLSGSADRLNDFRLRFTNPDPNGAGEWVLSEIHVSDPCTAELDSGIRIGSTGQQVQEAYPDAQVSEETLVTNDVPKTRIGYTYLSGDLYLDIQLTDDAVDYIALGGINAEHIDWDAENKPKTVDPYTFTPYETLSGGTITAYSRTDNGWKKQELTGKQAKHIVTSMNIMDPEESTIHDAPVIWLVFESGGVVALYGETNDTAVYHLEDAQAFEEAMNAETDPIGALVLIGYYNFYNVWEDTVSTLETTP